MADASEDTLHNQTDDVDPTDEVVDFRFLTAQKLPSRGIKDFEPHGTKLQRLQPIVRDMAARFPLFSVARRSDLEPAAVQVNQVRAEAVHVDRVKPGDNILLKLLPGHRHAELRIQ